MLHRFEYMVVYTTPKGRRVSLYKGMDQKELDQLLKRLRRGGCNIDKVVIVRHCS
ncbi:MAG: hypothetical protein GX357_00800 [Firmicutes bacterium]|nr:hypothetical protein [Bacillota bacterium]